QSQGRVGRDADPERTLGLEEAPVLRVLARDDLCQLGNRHPGRVQARRDHGHGATLRRSERPIRIAAMCRNIHTLFNFEPPATEDEILDASLQFVRKISGFTKPSQANEEAFARAVDEVAAASHRMLDALVTSAAPKAREVEADRARARAAKRFAAA